MPDTPNSSVATPEGTSDKRGPAEPSLSPKARAAAHEQQTLMEQPTPIRKNPPPRSPSRPGPHVDSPSFVRETNEASPTRSGSGTRQAGPGFSTASAGHSRRPHHHPHHARHGRHHASAASTASKMNQIQQDIHHPDYHHSRSFPDRIGAAALGGTIDLLKFTTGVAWTTTGALVAPPLHVTRTLILPQLMAALSAHVADVTPRRLQDWWRIVSSSICHVVTLLQSTRRGKEFRHSIVSVLVDIVEVMTSETFRQVLVDGMSTVVKVAEACSTPQARDAMCQVGLLMTRGVELLATRPSRQMMQDVVELVASFAVLLADPTTIVALAQVTADLCYALEAEEAQLYKKTTDSAAKDDDKNAADSSSAEKHFEAKRGFQQQRRKERNQTDALSSTDKILTSDPNATMEQVILSSLGETVPSLCLDAQLGDVRHFNDNDDNHSLPSVIVASSQTDADDNLQHTHDQLENYWEAMHGEGEDALPPPQNRDGARVDVAYLHDRVHQRSRRGRVAKMPPSTAPAAPSQSTPTAANNNKKRVQQPPVETVAADDDENDGEEDVSVDVEELGMEDAKASTRVRLFEESDDDEIHLANDNDGSTVSTTNFPVPAVQTERLQGEAASDHFYRVLDETLMNMRADAFKQVVLDGSKDCYNDASAKRGRVVSKVPIGEPDDYTKTSMKRILNNLRDEIADERSMRATPNALGRSINLTFLAIVSLLVLSWIGLGGYGLYVIIYRSRFNTGNTRLAPRPNMASDGNTGGSQEIVIKIVREVVHVDSNGNLIGQGFDSKILSDKAVDRLSQCIVDAEK